MSIIAQKWAYSQPIKNPIAKNILAFLASHNFDGNKTFFSIQTICGATAYSRTAVIENLKWLGENKYIIKEMRISENGAQKSNVYILNIPQEYLNNFCSDYAKLSTPPVRQAHPPSTPGTPPPVRLAHPNNKNINNNINKSFYICNDQKQNESRSNAKPWKNDGSNFANVENQSTSYQSPEKIHIESTAETVKKAMELLPKSLKPLRYRDKMS